jgi:hypothetical protein
MFGVKKYQYRLQLQQEFPSTIFKERNINICLNLVDKNSQKVLNGKPYPKQQTSCTSALVCATITASGSLRTGRERTS